jgi:hypothetical protein
MTKFMNPSFSVHVGGKAYSDGWEAIFGEKRKTDEEFFQEKPRPVGDCPSCHEEMKREGFVCDSQDVTEVCECCEDCAKTCCELGP